jgi:hypothetical protein
MLQPIVALLAGILILLIPRILNFVVAIYLIFVGVTGLWAVSPGQRPNARGHRQQLSPISASPTPERVRRAIRAAQAVEAIWCSLGFRFKGFGVVEPAIVDG